ncbi:hypothetical protein F0562_016343 [Nyssa sinensis]|uniref:Uncharacterized protein n=1 Tax=Nyssa sinensis TaxID=561372 RepID=A0A5J4ZJE4_9ASTE|nr:hypothetical protein F0562_016343 [Nyssa sinensis]
MMAQQEGDWSYDTAAIVKVEVVRLGIVRFSMTNISSIRGPFSSGGEWNRNWPFLVGFAVTGAIITKFSLGLTEEDAKNSPFVQRHKRYAAYGNLG